MLIIDKKHKDYYDGVVGTMGVDKSIVFERKMVEIYEKSKFPKSFQRGGWGDKNKLSQFFSYRCKTDKYDNASHFIVGFCGKLYLGFKMERDNPNERFFGDKIIDFTYDVNYFVDIFNPHWSFNEFTDYVNLIKKFDCLEIHRELNTPIFLFDSNLKMKYGKDECFIINPLLKNYEFYKVFDTFTAFQEIQMYISGVLGVGENTTIEVSDKDKIISRGFDYKWSFRKEPKEKK